MFLNELAIKSNELSLCGSAFCMVCYLFPGFLLLAFTTMFYIKLCFTLNLGTSALFPHIQIFIKTAVEL